MQLSSRLNIAPSITLEINTLAQKKKQLGEPVYNLSVGEPSMSTPDLIIDAGMKAMNAGKTQYTPVLGITELRQATVDWVNRMYLTSYSLSECMITNGAKYGLYMLLQALVNPGDEVVVIAPFWVSYQSMTELALGKTVVVQTAPENGWKVTVDQLERVCSSKTRCLILNNAGNPTGVLYTRQELGEILEFAKQKQIMVISDEVYSGLVYDGEEFVSCGSFSEYKEQVIVVQSASKNFAMTGWRVGMVLGSASVINALGVLQGQTTSNTSSISQWATVVACENAETVIADVRQQMQLRRDVFVTAVQEYVDVSVPTIHSALYAFLPLTVFGSSGSDSVQWCKEVLNKANVALVPGRAFGVEGYVRASFGVSPEEIRAGLKQLAGYSSVG